MYKDQWQLLAAYNAWMNEKVYAAAAQLTPEALKQDRKAFFGSILGTLNHLAVGDTLWLKRFRAHSPTATTLAPLDGVPMPDRLDQILFDDLASLADYRKLLDGCISAWIQTLTVADLASVVQYRNTKGIENRRSVEALLLHFFNHQTHHRGQVTDLLYQAGVDVGVTDLMALIPEAD